LSWFYSAKEGINALVKSKFSSLLSILTIMISIFFLGIFVVFIFQGWSVVRELKSQIEMEVFLKDGIGAERVQSVRTKLQTYEEVEAIVHISKEEALNNFKTEFGENVVEVLGENPLPASIQLKLKSEFHEKQKVEQLQKNIEALTGVDDVIYRYDLLQLIVKYLKILVLITFLVGGLLFFTSILLISNTIRLSIFSKRDSIKIMGLVGATPSFIRRPFVFEGALQGFLGAMLAIFGLLLGSKMLALFLPGININFGMINYGLLVWGVLLGSIGSWVSIRRYLQL